MALNPRMAPPLLLGDLRRTRGRGALVWSAHAHRPVSSPSQSHHDALGNITHLFPVRFLPVAVHVRMIRVDGENGERTIA